MVNELKVFSILFKVLVKIEEFFVFFEVIKDMELNVRVIINEVMDIMKVV